MIPNHSLGLMALALMGVGLLRTDGKTKERRLLDRLDDAEKRALEIAYRRATSPAVAAAEAKRARRAEKLRRIAA